MSTCYADPNPRFTPAMRLISAVTKSNPAIITTTFEHGYVDGTIVRFSIPIPVGMTQLDKLSGKITIVDANNFSVDIDTTLFDTFAIPIAPRWCDNTCALVIPMGEVSDQLTACVQDVTL